jgi:hypothetical protein
MAAAKLRATWEQMTSAGQTLRQEIPMSDQQNPAPDPGSEARPAEPPAVVMAEHVLPGGETIEIDGSTVDHPETGEPQPAAVLRLPLGRVRGLAEALDRWNRVYALVTDRGFDLIEEELSTALAEAADTLTDPDRAAQERAAARAEELSGWPEHPAARAEQVRHAYDAALAWLRSVTWTRPAPRAVFTGLKETAARLTSGEDTRDPAQVLIQFAIAAVADSSSGATERTAAQP